MRPTWAEISLSALEHNFRQLRDLVAPQAAVCAVVKCDAYGHGLVECARALEAEGARWVGVTSTEEGVRLRQAGIVGRILLMTGFWPGANQAEAEDLVRHQLTPAVWDSQQVRLLQAAAAKLEKGSASVPVHLKVDTGMARLGAALGDLPALLSVFKSTPRVLLDGVFTHLASAEILDAPDVEAQIARFDDAVAAVVKSGFSPSCYHMANSAAMLSRPRTWKNLVRPGIALYGYCLPFVTRAAGAADGALQRAGAAPAGEPARRPVELSLQPVLSWKTRVLSLRHVGAGQPIGYDGAYITSAPARIAALPVGYGDGLNRRLSSRGRVIVKGEYAPVVGNISMDITLIDVTAIPGIAAGDEATVIGAVGSRSVTAWEHANLASTIPYEVLCNISQRVPRKYIE